MRAPAEQGPKVYLSYNSKEAKAVVVLAERLKEDGINVWLDRWELNPGSLWREAVEGAKTSSATWVIFLGPNGLGPIHGREVDEAFARITEVGRGGFVIPVLLPGVTLEQRRELPPLFREVMWVDFQHLEDRDAYDQLLSTLRRIQSGAQRTKTAEAAPEVVPEAAPAADLAWTKEPVELASFFLRLIIRNRAAMPLLENPDTTTLAEALRGAGIQSADELARWREGDADAATRDMKPNPLWVAWLATVRDKNMTSIGKALRSLEASAPPAGREPGDESVFAVKEAIESVGNAITSTTEAIANVLGPAGQEREPSATRPGSPAAQASAPAKPTSLSPSTKHDASSARLPAPKLSYTGKRTSSAPKGKSGAGRGDLK